VDGRGKPGHDGKESYIQLVGRRLKMLDAFSVRLLGMRSNLLKQNNLMLRSERRERLEA
jgi:hypothetical protein